MFSQADVIQIHNYIYTKIICQISGFPCCCKVTKELQGVPGATQVNSALNWWYAGALYQPVLVHQAMPGWVA